jgi:hypothetical protein
MGQVGVYSASLLMEHNHLNASMGGILNDYSRYGAYREAYRTGALNVEAVSLINKDSTSLVEVLIKEIKINKGYKGQWRIEWDFFSTLGVSDVHSRLMLNGVPLSPDYFTTSSVPVTKTYDHDLAFNAGDLLQVWGYREGGGDRVNIEGFKIRYNWGIKYFGDGTVMNLASMLPLSDIDVIDFTIQDP